MSTPSRVSQAAHSSYDLSSGQPSSSSLQGSDGKTPMQPRPPVKPLVPYMRYTRKVTRSVWNSVHAKNQNLKFWEIGAIIGQMWKELGDEEKQQYTDEYESEKIQYAEALKVYHDSPAYQSWIAAKEKADTNDKPAKGRRRKIPRLPVEQRVIVIQPIEEEEDLDGLSVMQLASSGYQHNLNSEIYSEAVVPDKKLENVQQQIEEKHGVKKCKFADSSEHSYEYLRDLCDSKPQIGDGEFSLIKKEKPHGTLLPEDESTVSFDVTLYGCGFCDETFQIEKEFMEHCERHYCENRQKDTLLELFEICLSM